MQVVEALAHARSAMSLASLSALLELPKTSLMHLLRALEAASYVKRSETGFQIGDGSYRLAAKIGTADNFETVAQQVMQGMLEATRETILLGAFSEGRRSAVYTARLPSPEAIRFAPEVGTQRPLYSTALGKLLLAYAPEVFVTDYLGSLKLVPFTRRTVSSKHVLREQLRQIRTAGMAVSIDEMADGGSALAAPVFDRTGRLYCGLVIAVPTHRMRANRSKLKSVLLDGALRLSGLLGHAAVNAV